MGTNWYLGVCYSPYNITNFLTTLSVTMEDMIHHTAAVARGTKNALVVGDMPFLSYNTGIRDAVINAGRL